MIHDWLHTSNFETYMGKVKLCTQTARDCYEVNFDDQYFFVYSSSCVCRLQTCMFVLLVAPLTRCM